MNKNEFINEVKKLNIDINKEILEKLDKYCSYLQEYNQHTNLTAIKEEPDIYLKHFYDSLTIVKVIDLNQVDSLLDIGSGAGFPGMVIKIFFPNINVTLLDSNNKKTKFLTSLAQLLNIDVNIVNQRVEEYSQDNLNKFMVVTSRAVANLRVLAELSLPLVKENGYFIPLKGNLDKKLEDSMDTIKIMGGKIISRVEFNLYENNGMRNILLIEKTKKTDSKLRSYEQIIKKPLKKISK